jgi:nitroimidazol reductase NimA-like FMN-containing flavoprotein (pyridoxamine 5'-phosphate oxidase superfamily)
MTTTQLTRLAEYGVNERAELNRLLDDSLIAHVGVTDDDGHPVVIPTGIARDGDSVLIHGSTGSGWMRRAADGRTVCVTVTELTGIIVARSAFESSMRYRSAVLFGSLTVVEGDAKVRALDLLTDHMIPGRVAEVRRPTNRERAATMVLRLPIERWSLKINVSWPDDDPSDMEGDAWAGVVPYDAYRTGTPLPAPDLRPGIEMPASVRELLVGQPGERTHRYCAEPLDAKGYGGEPGAGRGNLIQSGHMLDHGNPGRQQKRVCGPLPVGGVVDVDGVDADEYGTVLGEPGSTGTGEEVVIGGVSRRSEPGIIAGVQQHGLAADVMRGQCPHVDTAPPGASDSYDYRGKVDGASQGDCAEVGPVAKAVIRRIKVGTGVANQGKPVDSEFRARSIVLSRGFPGQVGFDRRFWKPRVCDHAGADYGLLREFCDGSRWVKGPGRACCAGM